MSASGQLVCRSCGGPLNGREGRFVLRSLPRRSAKDSSQSHARQAVSRKADRGQHRQAAGTCYGTSQPRRSARPEKPQGKLEKIGAMLKCNRGRAPSRMTAGSQTTEQSP